MTALIATILLVAGASLLYRAYRMPSGVGLGLAIVPALITAAGGAALCIISILTFAVWAIIRLFTH